MATTVYFVLQPATWSGIDSHLCRPLLGSRRADDIPWVSVARSSAHGQVELVKRDGLDGAAARALVSQARTWIDTNELSWQVVAQRGFLFWKRPSMLRPINAKAGIGLTTDPMDDLSSELVLSPRALAEAAAKLGSSDLIAAIPKRGWLVLAPGSPGELPRMLEVHQIADGVFGRAEAKDALTDTVFFVQNGAVSGISRMKANAGSLSLLKPDEAAWQFPN